MADDAGGPSGQGGAGHQAQGGDGHQDFEKPIQPMKNDSRKSTWVKSPFDIQVSDMATPLPQSRRTSHHGIDLDEYFVS